MFSYETVLFTRVIGTHGTLSNRSSPYPISLNRRFASGRGRHNTFPSLISDYLFPHPFAVFGFAPDSHDMKRTATTRTALITAAGELFAQLGYEGVSTRMIADLASVKVSAIHYHFGSKEKLYIETCLAAHARGNHTTFTDLLQENPRLMESPEGQAEIIRTAVFRKFHDHFRPDRPAWEARILLREIASPTVALSTLVDVVYRPDNEATASFYKTVRPTASDDEASTWADLIYGQILLYSMAGKSIVPALAEDSLSQKYYHTAAATLARAMILEAGLPLPADLQ